MTSVVALLAAAAYAAPETTVTRQLRLDPGAARVAAPIGFRAVAASWPAGELRVRASADGEQWTPWTTVEGEAVYREDGAPAGRVSGLVWFGEVQRYLETAGDARGAEVIFIDPGLSSGSTPRARAAVPSDEWVPRIVPREQWGCTPQTCPQAEPPVYSKVTHLIVHHTAGANTATDWAAVVRSIWVLHVQGNGWNDIGYNFLVAPDGVIYEGRAGGDGVVGAHFSGVNSGTMGVALLGTYSTVAAPDNALAALAAVLTWQAHKWTLDPTGQSLHASSGLRLNTISGHRDAGLSPRATSTTECPGNGVYAILHSVRGLVRHELVGSCPMALPNPYGCVASEAGTLDVPVAARPGCAWTAASQSPWLEVEAGAPGMLRVRYTANPSAVRTGTVVVAGQATLTVAQMGPGAPAAGCITTDGVVSAGKQHGYPVVPGSLVSVYGSKLADQEPPAPGYPLPTSLGGVTLLVNGSPVPLQYVSPGQINAQLPPGLATGTARAAVRQNGVEGPDTNFWVTEAAPSLFVAGERVVAVNYDDGLVNTPRTPARPGSIVTVYLTGAGAVQGGIPAGGAAATEARRVSWPARAEVDFQAAELLYLGLAPGTAGIYQANVRLPAGVTAGDRWLSITVAGVSSGAWLAVGR